MVSVFRFLALLSLVATAGCATTVSLPPYSPVTTAEVDAGVQVADFKYSPKAGVQPNVIHNTAAGEFRITEPVGTYVGNAVRREFRQAGMSLRPESQCRLSGEVNDLTLDDLGFSVDYISDFSYALHRGNDGALFEKAYQVKFTTDKFVVAEVIFANINKVISDNIGKLMADPAFVAMLRDKCPKPA